MSLKVWEAVIVTEVKLFCMARTLPSLESMHAPLPTWTPGPSSYQSHVVQFKKQILLLGQCSDMMMIPHE